MKIITHKMIDNLNLDLNVWYKSTEHVIKNKQMYNIPAKTNIYFESSYFDNIDDFLSLSPDTRYRI